MSRSPLLIDEPGLSRAWSRALIHLMDEKATEVAPLIFSVSGYHPNGIVTEDGEVRTALDAWLEGNRKLDVENVAFTIFPQEIWDIAAPDREEFFELALGSFPDYQAMNPGRNRRGLYWQRLMDFGGMGDLDGNQLRFILNKYNDRAEIRRSLLQAATFDPRRDHDPNPRLGFPCLQQVSFVPSPSGLTVNAFYATQRLLEKAYGNLLGLSRLGAFMGSQMNLRMERLNVYVGVENVGGVRKRDPEFRRIVDAARALTNAAP